jgi:hypothetical protein
MACVARATGCVSAGGQVRWVRHCEFNADVPAAACVDVNSSGGIAWYRDRSILPLRGGVAAVGPPARYSTAAHTREWNAAKKQKLS